MELKFKEPISKALHELGFTKLTEVQAQAIPLAMQGEDLIVQSRTGTGKTAAFALPILEATWQKSQVQTLVLTPTRELALQINEAMTQLSQAADQTRESLHEFKTATEQLNDAVQGLQGEVSRFRISA